MSNFTSSSATLIFPLKINGLSCVCVCARVCGCVSPQGNVDSNLLKMQRCTAKHLLDYNPPHF